MTKNFSSVLRVVGAAVAVGSLALTGVAYATVPTLSQTSITVGASQSATVTSQNGTNVYLGSNSAPTVVSVSINGTQVTITGLAPGSASLTLCGVGTASDCTNLAVTVQIGTVTAISFNPSSLSLNLNASQGVTISGGNGNYSVSTNSNTSVASTNLSGTTLTVSGLATGGATIKVCDTTNACGNLSVTIGSAGSTSTSTLSFGSNNISLSVGASQAVTISGGTGSYNITGNTNPIAASPGMSGNSITVYGSGSGSATITVCDTASKCGTLAVTVGGSTSNTSSNGGVTFSVTNPTVAVGQTLNVTLSGGATNYVVLSNIDTDIAQATITNSSTLSLTGSSAGSDTVTVCATGGNCAPLSVTVTGTGSASTPTPTPTPNPTPSPTPTPTPVSGGVANATLLAEIQTLQAAVTQVLNQIQSIQTQLNQLSAQVNAGGTVSTGGGSGASFTELLKVGSQDAQVTALQQQLAALGFYSGPVTGYYGSLTQQAVMKYQTAHGLQATGEVGVSTRAALNAGN